MLYSEHFSGAAAERTRRSLRRKGVFARVRIDARGKYIVEDAPWSIFWNPKNKCWDLAKVESSTRLVISYITFKQSNSPYALMRRVVEHKI